MSYTCKDDSTDESFSIKSFRYVGASDGDSVYFHCDLKVCLESTVSSTCDCPTLCGPPGKRKRRAFEDIVDESEVYHVTAGPFIFTNIEEDEKEQEEENDKVNNEGT